MAVTMNAATFMGTNFSTIQNFIMNSEDLTLKQMFDITAKLVGEQEEINNLDNIHWGKNFMETTVTDWWWNSYQSSAHKNLCLLRFCVVPREDPSTSRFQRSLEEQNWRGHNREKLQRLWRYRWRADRTRVENLPRIHNVAALR